MMIGAKNIAADLPDNWLVARTKDVIVKMISRGRKKSIAEMTDTFYHIYIYLRNLNVFRW